MRRHEYPDPGKRCRKGIPDGEACESGIWGKTLKTCGPVGAGGYDCRGDIKRGNQTRRPCQHLDGGKDDKVGDGAFLKMPRPLWKNVQKKIKIILNYVQCVLTEPSADEL